MREDELREPGRSSLESWELPIVRQMRDHGRIEGSGLGPSAGWRKHS